MSAAEQREWLQRQRAIFLFPCFVTRSHTYSSPLWRWGSNPILCAWPGPTRISPSRSWFP